MSIDTTSIDNQDAAIETKPGPTSDPPIALRDIKEDLEFYFPDGNLYLRVNKHEFFVHKYKLGEFQRIEPMLEFKPESHQVLELEGDENDFSNTFRVLYASFYYASVSDFGAPVLISALRLATKYDHSALRKFAIDNLEVMQLPPMDYLPLAREFDVVEWEKRALDHLAVRDEPVTVAEAALLGTESFVAMIVRRERRLIQAHQKPAEEKPVIPATDAPTVSESAANNTMEDVIDLSDVSDEQARQENQAREEDQTHPDDLGTPDSGLSGRHPRTRMHLRQSLSSTPNPSNKLFARQNGVSKKPGRKRKW